MEGNITQNSLPLVVIVGPTASGKTSLAIALAKKHGGEIIAADSRTIYKGLDIGTAKPTLKEQDGVTHWGFDLIDPSEHFSAAEFKGYAASKIADIRKKGKIPFLVGGTGLYVDAVLYDFSFTTVNLKHREELEKLSVGELQERCIKHNIELPNNVLNKRHLVSAILRKGQNPQRNHQPKPNTIIVGITTDKLTLQTRIRDRAKKMLMLNIVNETTDMIKSYGASAPGLTGNAYRVVDALTRGGLSEDEAIEQIYYLDWHLAKRQLTWFRRDKNIKWKTLSDAEQYIDQALSLLRKNMIHSKIDGEEKTSID